MYYISILYIYINLYRRSDYGSQLEPEHVAVNKLIMLVLCVTDLIRILVIC